MVNSGSASSTPVKKTATSRAHGTSASGRGGVKAPKRKKASDADTTSEDDEPTASPSVGRKRARNSTVRKSYAESDATSGDEDEKFTPMSKKVKIELLEEEGVTASASNNIPPEEEDEEVAYI